VTAQDRHYQAIADLLADSTSAPGLELATDDMPAFTQACLENGVAPLLHQLLSKQQEQAPTGLIDALRNATTRATIFESQHTRLLAQVGERLAAAGIRTLVFKGSALAYQFYDPPYLRERCDTDMLFESREQALAAAELLTRDLGFLVYTTAEGSLISYEKAIYKTDELGLHHELDLHWHISNNNIYGNTYSFDELYARGQTTCIVDGEFRTPSTGDAFIIACLHRMANIAEGKESRLIWLYDIKLMADRFTPDDWHGIAQCCIDKHIAHACLMSIGAASDTFSQPIGNDIRDQLIEAIRSETIPTRFLDSTSGGLIGNILALPGWQLRLRSVLQVLFPSLAYMRHKYRFHHPALAPYYYLVRIVGGTKKAITQRR